MDPLRPVIRVLEGVNAVLNTLAVVGAWLVALTVLGVVGYFAWAVYAPLPELERPEQPVEAKP